MALTAHRRRVALLLLTIGVVFFLTSGIWLRSKVIRAELKARQTKLSTQAVSHPAPRRFGLPLEHHPFTDYSLEPAFGDLKFTDPVAVVAIPDRPGSVAVAQRNGMIYAVTQREGNFAREVYLDLRQRVHTRPNLAEEGLLGLAFHPGFAERSEQRRAWLFVSYTGLVYDQPTHRVTRFEAPKHSSSIHDRSETILIDQPYASPRHKGGCLAFGPDGYLYASFGDDGDEVKNAQRVDGGFFSGILRIDVDQHGEAISQAPRRGSEGGHGQNYSIPNDNPFANDPNALGEFFAIGFRNPWRFSFDRATGDLLVSDVGDKAREEVSLIRKGDNAGWPLREGSLARTNPPQAPSVGRERLPAFEYSRAGFHLAIIGGFVYRGAAHRDLVGKYLYADQSGRVYAVDLPRGDEPSAATTGPTPKLLASLDEAGVGISHLGEDEQGEPLLCAIGELGSETGRVYRIRRNFHDPLNQPPDRLSQTGLFKNLAALEPADGFVAYDVVSPLWSDGAVKRRWVAIPQGEVIHGKLLDRWRYPTGSVFVKHFEFPSAKHPGGTRRVGTRYLLVDAQGAAKGATYRWNEDQTDAFRVDDSEDAVFEIENDAGERSAITWSHPGRLDCQRCHNSSAGYVLGFNYKQLNRLVLDEERKIETGQLVRLRNLGLLENTFADDAIRELPRLFAIDDEAGDVEARVRSYLDVNCAPCHQPGLHYARFDARLTTPLEMANLIEGAAFHTRAGEPLDWLIVPGAEKESLLVDRMRSVDSTWRMPPLGRNVTDEKAIELMRKWVESLPKSDVKTAGKAGDLR
jgi:uncharacterized repeat protein (TIGR03806 family)